MHTPCCIRPYRCLECDNRRANTEIRRLREVLRVTRDKLIDSEAEALDMRGQRDRLLNDIQFAKEGRISVTELPSKFTSEAILGAGRADPAK